MILDFITVCQYKNGLIAPPPQLIKSKWAKIKDSVSKLEKLGIGSIYDFSSSAIIYQYCRQFPPQGLALLSGRFRMICFTRIPYWATFRTCVVLWSLKKPLVLGVPVAISFVSLWKRFGTVTGQDMSFSYLWDPFPKPLSVSER